MFLHGLHDHVLTWSHTIQTSLAHSAMRLMESLMDEFQPLPHPPSTGEEGEEQEPPPPPGEWQPLPSFWLMLALPAMSLQLTCGDAAVARLVYMGSHGHRPPMLVLTCLHEL